MVLILIFFFSFPNHSQPLETYNYHKAKEAFRNFKNVTRTISGLSSDESSSVIDNASSSDETTKEQNGLVDGLVNGKKNPNLHLLFTSSSVILTSEDEGLGHDDSSRRLYRSEEEAFSGPSSLERENEKQSKKIDQSADKKSDKKLDKKSDKTASGRAVVAVDRCTSPLMNVNELEAKLGRLEKQNNDLIEQNLELEEAENDARLMSQKLKIKVDNLLEQIDNLQVNLEQSQEFIKSSQCDLNEFKKREDKLLEQIKDLQIKLEDERNISSLSTISSEDWKADKELSMLADLNDDRERNNKNHPICDSIKPVKIDLASYNNEPQLIDSLDNSLDNQINSPINGVSDDCLMSQQSIDSHLKALENNQEELNDRLKHLQTVNREFVRDLEQREHLLTKKELLFKEWITKESLLRRNIAELNNELDELNKQFNVAQRQRAELRAKCEELHLQLTELERGDTLQDDSEQLPLSSRQKEMHELIVNCKQQEYDHRLIELMTQFKTQFDAQIVKDMERTEQTQVILDKFFAQDLELQEEMRQLLSKQNELKEQVHKQQKNLEKVSSNHSYFVFWLLVETFYWFTPG